MRGATIVRRPASPMPRLAVAAATLLVVAVAGLPGARGAFVGSTASTGAFTSAASFPDYPASVNADHPLLYHRLDDAAGSVTAADSSGNGATGVYGMTKLRGWNGLWPMDENAGLTAGDLSGAATPHPLTRNGANWAPGHDGSALSFNGTTDDATTTASVTATNTAFTVAAWVYLTDTSVSRTAVSQDGTDASGFELGYDRDLNRWVFAMPRSDSAAAAVDKAASTAAPATGVWTHLTASYRSSSNRLYLWVNGQFQSFVVFGGTLWNATGALVVGAGLSTTRTHRWQGTVDNVRVSPLQAGSDDVSRELTIGASGSAATSWQFEENTAGVTGTADVSGNANTGTLGAGAAWGAARYGASSIDLAGDANGYVAGTAPGVDTSKSFTVSAWVYLDHTALGTMSRIAVSQSGTVKSGFMLRYDHLGTRWEFAVTAGAADDSAPAYDSSYSANSSAALTTWTHLVGVYDSVAGTATLYVNGVAQAPAAHTSVFDATGPLQAGRVKEFGSWLDGTTWSASWGPWAGRIDDVRTFRRALGPAEINAIRLGGHAFTTLGIRGALQGPQQGQTGSTAQAFGNGFSPGFNPTRYTNPTTYSLECWFRTAGLPGAPLRGQTLMSFGDQPEANSPNHDRELFLDVSGHLVAGTFDTATGVQSTATYWDNRWHHAAVTVSPANGIRLYADGVLIGAAAYTAPRNFTGYWRWGGDTWTPVTWLADFNQYGLLDEVAVYGTELSAQQVSRHFHANH
jgi:hypothetical protein